MAAHQFDRATHSPVRLYSKCSSQQGA